VDEVTDQQAGATAISTAATLDTASSSTATVAAQQPFSHTRDVFHTEADRDTGTHHRSQPMIPVYQA
jgi:hypothetical protein